MKKRKKKDDVLTSEQRARFNEIRKKLEEKHVPLIEKIKESTRIIAEDLAITVY